MRRIDKKEIPEILDQNYAKWTEEFKNDPTNATKRYRYRDPAIKSVLRSETSNKCVYCESKIGHNTPGDVEHKIPTDTNKDMHFLWSNLTIACGECNRRKSNYFDQDHPFLDPYVDDVEARVVHHGPCVGWFPGDVIAEISVRTLELDNYVRTHLISRKIECIDKLNNLAARLKTETGVLKALLAADLEKMQSRDAEYSAMILTICATYGIAAN